jgi:hypothetical protein
MLGKNIWKSSSLLVSLEGDLLEAKGKKVDVGTTKIYSAKDKKYAGKEVYHVYQKTAEPGKKAWKYIGTVGSKTNKADNHLKLLGINVENGKPVGVDITKGKSMMIPPPETASTSNPAPESPIKGPDGTPINLKSDNAVEFYSAILPDLPGNEEDLYAAGMDASTVELFKHVAASVQQAGKEGNMSWPSVFAALQAVTGKSAEELSSTYGSGVKDSAHAMVQAMVDKGVPFFAKAGYQISYSPASSLINKPKPMPAPEPPDPGNVTSYEQSVFNHKFKDMHAFVGAVDKATENFGYDTKALEALKSKYPDIVKETGGSVMGAYSMADELYIAPGSAGKQGLDAKQVYDNWAKTHAGKTHADMANLYGDNWSKVAWGMAASISKAKNGPGDKDTPVFKPKKIVPAVSPLTTASGFKVVPSGSGKKVANGTTKIQPEKNGNLQVHVKQDGSWIYLGTVGAKKGAKKGAAEAHLKTLGIETNGKKLKDLDVTSALAMVPTGDGKAPEVPAPAPVPVPTQAPTLTPSQVPTPASASTHSYPQPSKKIIGALKGFDSLYDMVKSAGGVAGLGPNVTATFDLHQPDWKQHVQLANLITDWAGKEGELTSMLDQALDNPTWDKTASKSLGADWKERAVEIIKQLKGSYPVGTGTLPPPGIPGAITIKGVGPELIPISDFMPGGSKAKAEPKPKPKKKKKKPVAVPSPIAPTKPDFVAGASGTPAADLPIPPPSGLTKSKDAGFLGGAGQKAIYTDSNGNEFLFKLATKKGSGKADPMRAYVQAAFSEIAKQIKPIHPKIEVTELGGVVGAIYPFLPGATKVDLSGESPSSLSSQEKLDVAEEHVIDWLTSQHDSHSKNFLRTDEGRIIGVDKEQGFKYFGDDKLSISYHPNSKYGENEPFYNAFWREFSQGKNDFDPKLLAGAIDKATAVPTATMEQALTPYAKVRFPGDSIAQASFVRNVLNRKNTLKRDYEKFVTDLMEKREGTSGTFTFATGWVKQGEEDKPYEKVTNHPEKTESGDAALTALGGTSKSVPHKTDASKLTIKTSESAESLKTLLEDLGFPEEAKSIKTGGHYKMAFVDKAAWEKAGKTTPAWTETETVHPEPKGIGPSPTKPSYMPIVTPPKATVPNSDLLKSIDKKTQLGLGLGVTLDGPLVEGSRARVIRRKDSKGEYYEVSFKLRELAHKDIYGGDTIQYQFPSGKLTAKSDTLSATATPVTSSPAKQWSSDAGDINLLSTEDTTKYAYKGMVVAKVRTKNINTGLKKLLNTMKPGLAKDIVRDPTDDDREVTALSGALFALRPKRADALAKRELTGDWERTPKNLRKELKKYMTPEQLDSVDQVEVGPNFASPIIPGRWKNLAGGTAEDPHARFLFWELSDPKKLVNMFKGGVGAAGINERNAQGIAAAGSSYHADVGTGCASGMTVRVATKNNDGKKASGGYGAIRIIVAPDELDRTDAFLHKGDQYGCMNPNKAGTQGASYRNRKDLNDSLTTASLNDELVVRQVLPAGKILRVSVDSETIRQNTIKAFKSDGIHEVNGVPVEDFVVLAGGRSVKEIYETYVKPAGF